MCFPLAEQQGTLSALLIPRPTLCAEPGASDDMSRWLVTSIDAYHFCVLNFRETAEAAQQPSIDAGARGGRNWKTRRVVRCGP